MIIKKMTATFGRLEGAVLELEEGLNLLQLPNEGGKSTWCAFLRAMFYGIPTRERDTKTTLAEKNLYAPWSGSPMAGEVLLTWRGRDIFLRRFAKGTAPFGGFEAVEAATGRPVPGLTGENCGQVLLGVSREVWQRSAFVGQSGLPVEADPELERRIAALVSSGEEDVSYAQAEKTLRGWLNRRRHNKTGLIPQLEEELRTLEGEYAAARDSSRRLREAQAQASALEERKKALEAEREAQRARRDWALLEQYQSASGELSRAQAELSALEGANLPDKETLRKAQGDLTYYHTLTATLKEAAGQRGEVRARVDAAEAAAADPLFPDKSPDQAWRQASGDAAKVRALEEGSGTRPLTAAGLILLAAAAVFAGAGVWTRTPPLLAAAVLAALVGAGALLTGRKRAAGGRAQRAGLLDRYGAKTADEILDRAGAYRDRWAAAEEARRNAEALEDSIRDLTERREALWRRLITFVHGFAPEVTDPFGVSAALSRALSQEERRSTARVKVQGAQKLVDALTPPTAENNEMVRRAQAAGGGDCPAPPPVAHTPQQTAAALSAVTGELQRVREALSRAQGEGAALGDPAELEHRLEELRTALDRRRREYAALELALEVLQEANNDLHARFTPLLDRRTGEIFSALTGGKYQGVSLTRELDAAVQARGDVLPRRALTLSRGTVGQLYLAVRLAVCQLALPAEDPSPLVLDDALADFDDGRMALALDALGDLARERQVLLFTCHNRERIYLEDQG